MRPDLGVAVWAAIVPVASSTLLLLASPPPVSAQAPATMLGAVAGYALTEQIWEPEAEVDRVGGIVVGVYLDADTPKDWLSVLAEGTYTRRGGDVIDGGGAATEGAVRSDYLSLHLRPKVGVAAGPARLYVAGGPAMDLLIRSRVAPGFETVLDEEGTTVFGVMIGVGLDLRVAGGRTIGLEGRIYEGLGDAYSGAFVSVRNRSWEVVARFAVGFER